MFIARRRLPQFSLAALFAALTTVAIALGVWSKSARDQRKSVQEVRRLGGSVTYDYQVDAHCNFTFGAEPPRPEWLVRNLGIDYFSAVESIALEVFADEEVKVIAPLVSLRGVQLRGVPLSDTALGALSGMRHLRHLDLQAKGVTDAGMDRLAALRELEFLNLNGTSISDLGLERLQTLVNLETLWLSKTDVSDAGLRHLAAFPRLRSLSLTQTRINRYGAWRA